MNGNQNIPIVPPRKDNTWIWILVIVVVLCLCLTVIAAGIGIYVYQNQSHLPFIYTDVIPPPWSTPTLSQPDRTVPIPTIQNLPGEIVVEPYTISFTETIPSLAELADNYRGSMVPGVNTWGISLSSSQPVLLYMGWCTTTSQVLEENFSHLQLFFEADGALLAEDRFAIFEETLSEQVCRAKVGIIRQWPLGEHEIRITLRFDQQVNDGTSDYPPGDYVDIFNILVTP